jgi:hypothetical protein
MDGEFYWNDGPRQASFPSKAPFPAAEIAHSQKLEDIKLWADKKEHIAKLWLDPG